MTKEAENMLSQLRDAQNKIDSLELELFRKASNEDILNAKLKQSSSRVSDEQDKFGSEKKLLMDEILANRKERDQIERELSRAKLQLNEIKDDHSRNLVSLKSAEAKIETLRNQLSSEMDKTKVAEMCLTEKRAEVAQMEARLRSQEDKYLTAAADFQDQAKRELREEIRHLRQRLKEAELAAENDRFLRSKMSGDNSVLVKENAKLTQDISEITSQLEREHNLRENFDDKRSADIVELSRLKEHSQQLQYQVNRLEEDLNSEQERAQHYMRQLADQQTQQKSRGLESTLREKQLAESELQHRQLGEAVTELRRDKDFLIQHVDKLQTQLKEKESHTSTLNTHIASLEARLAALENSASMEGNLQSRKWEELEKMADTIRSHAHLMASTSSPRLSRKSKIPDYS